MEWILTVVFFFVYFFFLKTLLSEPILDESRWPPELILLREKFTAKSQLEIAQLQIKHEEEVSSHIEMMFIYYSKDFLQFIK